MKNYTITEEQIQELAKEFGSDNTTLLKSLLTERLKKWFPEVFETKLEVGKWYKDLEHTKGLYFLTKIDCGEFYFYGHSANGCWQNIEDRYSYHTTSKLRLATEEEVFEALKNEAVKRGFKKGVYVNDIYNGNGYTIISSNNFDYEEVPYREYNDKMALRDKFGNILFVDGIWAEIVPTLTKEEAEKKLNVKIID